MADRTVPYNSIFNRRHSDRYYNRAFKGDRRNCPIITVGALTFIAFLPTSPFSSEFPFISFKWLFDPFTVMPIQMFNWVSRPQHDFS